MTAQGKLDQQYANIMQNHPFGIAVYRPLSQILFKVGACGYFDDFGSWQPIVDLERPNQLLEKRLSPLEDELEKAPLDEGIEWGPKVSSQTKAKKIQLSGGVDPYPGIPVTVSTVYSYSTNSALGAVLFTSSPVTHERYYHESPFKNWVKKNAAVIFQRWPEVKKHGLWIITSTYATKKCAINMCYNGGRGFKVGFSAKAVMGEAGPSGEWHRDQADEGWGEYTAKGDDKLVVFFGGLRFRYKWILGKELNASQPSSRPIFRGSDDSDTNNQLEYITAIPSLDSEEDAHYAVTCDSTYLEEEAQISEEW